MSVHILQNPQQDLIRVMIRVHIMVMVRVGIRFMVEICKLHTCNLHSTFCNLWRMTNCTIAHKMTDYILVCCFRPQHTLKTHSFSATQHYWRLFGYHLYGDGICFANVAFLESILSTPLNGSLQNFNTWRVSVGNRTLQRDFLGIGPKKISGPKTTYFQWLHNLMATLRANISSEEHDRDNWEMALETTKGPLHRPKISWTLLR